MENSEKNCVDTTIFFTAICVEAPQISPYRRVKFKISLAAPTRQALRNGEYMSGTLFVVPTPIGNLDDISPRIIDALEKADVIAAEDTRNTLNLLNYLEIKTPLISNHKFNEMQKTSVFIDRLKNGDNVAVVSDAGTPCISDPGYILVNAAVEEGIEVIGICGPCAATTALSITGFNADSFTFAGFFPRKEQLIKDCINQSIKGGVPILIFYESPKRILKTMEVLSDIIPDANICLCNDLTKKFEKKYRGTPLEVHSQLTSNPNHEKGEYALVIKLNQELFDTPSDDALSPEAALIDFMIKNDCGLKDAMKQLTDNGDYSRNELYKASLNIKNMEF